MKTEYSIALCGELALEEAMDLSKTGYVMMIYIYLFIYFTNVATGRKTQSGGPRIGHPWH
jgi:hypothetical protein